VRRIAVLLAAAHLFASTASARELKRSARKRLEAGLKAYGEKDYDTAIREFRNAYKIDPDPDLLYALAQAERLAGYCGDAVVHYRQFLETRPDEMQVEAARTGIELCETAEAPADPPPQPEQPPSARRDPVWYKDPANGLIGFGAVAAGVGIGYIAAAASSRLGANRAATPEYELFLRDRASWQKRLGVTALVFGGAMVGGGIAWHVLRDRKDDTPTAVVTTDGTSLYITGTF
jgi:tetratricopeptide (TPR) repeat protein